ncbi:MAG: glycosyltransferase family 4 protein [Bacteriovoracaceae bacterium]|nr:glycosyltransferase family 4 protein [Bacteriovoracaceae bacterium]
MNKILWITPKWTFPLLDGARIATDSLVRSVIEAGAIVDNVCICDNAESISVDELSERWKTRAITLVPRSKLDSLASKVFFHLKTLLTKRKLPLTFAYFHEKNTRRIVSEIIETGDYDYIVLDALHLGVLFLNDNLEFHRLKTKAKIILRAHNVEYELWDEARKRKSFPLNILLEWQRNKVLHFEKLIYQSVDGIGSISIEDKEKISNEMEPQAIDCFPLGFDFSTPLSDQTINKEQFLFVGRLDWPPNRDGLEWLLKEVWPKVVARRPSAKLRIVGSGEQGWLLNYKNLKNLEILGYVKNLNDAYIDAAFTLVPMFYGSGTRIKVIESFVKNRPLISTQMGVQGANLDKGDYINAETAENWIETLSLISLNQNRLDALKNSRTKVEGFFSEKKVGVNFLNWLQSL